MATATDNKDQEPKYRISGARVLYAYTVADDRLKGFVKIAERIFHLSDEEVKQAKGNPMGLEEWVQPHLPEGAILQKIWLGLGDKFSENLPVSARQVYDILLDSGVETKAMRAEGRDIWFATDIAAIDSAVTEALEQSHLREQSRQDKEREFIGDAKKKKKKKTPAAGEAPAAKVSSPIRFRPEQQEAIARTIAHFDRDGRGDRDYKPRFLWNAKMRFGKTLSALEVAKQRGYKSVLIITHRPVVDDGWHEDFEKIFFDRPNYTYGSRNINDSDNIGNFDDLTRRTALPDGGFVFFVSMQYLRLSQLVGGKDKKPNPEKEAILNYPWELVVIDEAHEGTKSVQGSNVMKYLWLDTPETMTDTRKEAQKAKRSKRGGLRTLPHTLSLSGTPFNLYGDFSPAEIFTWDYVAEQEAKQTWNEENGDDPNPYDVLPRMHIFNHDIEAITGKIEDPGAAEAEAEADGGLFGESPAGFSFSRFFRVWTGRPKTDGAEIPGPGYEGRFIHEDKVMKFFHHLALHTEEGSNYPFSTMEFQEAFRHTFWMVPHVAEARALKSLLEQEEWRVDGQTVANPYYGRFKIINVAGSGDEEQDAKALLQVRRGIFEAETDHLSTITLSCGKLTTGVSVPEWTAVFYLKGNDDTSASAYLQTIFRVQTPAVIHGRQKTDAYVFDFSPSRSLRVFADAVKLNAAARHGRSEYDPTDHEAEHAEAEKWLKYLPLSPLVPGVNGKMVHYDANTLFDELNRHLTDRAVRSGYADNSIYDPVGIMNLDKEQQQALVDLGKLLNASGKNKKTPDIVINPDRPKTGSSRHDGDDSDGENPTKPKSEEEKIREAWNREKRNRMATLREMSVRIPLLMYGAEVEDENTELEISNFTTLFGQDRASWDEFMPKGVTPEQFDKLRTCYNPSVFRSSAKAIREAAREADRYGVEERIRKIAEIFSCFKNPDRETVLTPWRVVNLHMSDTLGGYTFFDESFTKERTPPRHVHQVGITKGVFGPETLAALEATRILELNSKTGLYPLYVAYSLYRARKDFYSRAHHQDSAVPLPDDRHIWDETLSENVFVVCKTEMARQITRRTLVGFRTADDGRPIHVNAVYPTWMLTAKELVRKNILKKKEIPNYKPDRRLRTALVNVLRARPDLFEKDVLSRRWWEKQLNRKLQNLPSDMIKFNAVVGNPPYQETTAKKETENGQKNVTNIFHFFQMAADKVGAITSLIYPGGRWIHQFGKGLPQFGLEQINDCHLSKLFFYPNANDVFDVVSLADGISIVLKDSKKTDTVFDYIYCVGRNQQKTEVEAPGKVLLPLNPFDDELIGKIESRFNAYNFPCLSDSIMPRSLFGIESHFVESNPTLVREYKEGAEFDPENEIKLFTNDKAGKSGRARWYVASKDVIKKGLDQLPKWKVIVSSANAGGQKRSNQIEIVDNHSAFGRARLALKTFDTKEEAENFFKYATSKLIRYTFLLTDESLNSLAKKVPDLEDYTVNNPYIDWNGDIDRQLFDLFGLGESEQQHIESVLAKYPQ